MTGKAYSHRRSARTRSLERFPCDGTCRHTGSTYRMVPSGPPVCVASRMHRLWPVTQHRPGTLLLYRVLAHHPAPPAPGVCPLRSAVCLADSHDLHSKPSMPTVSGTATGFSTGLDPLPLPSATAGRHLLVQVSGQTYTGTATRTPHDQRPPKRDRHRRDYPCALTPIPFTNA